MHTINEDEQEWRNKENARDTTGSTHAIHTVAYTQISRIYWEVEDPKAVVLRASSFELERSQNLTGAAEDVTGSFKIDDDNDVLFHALKELCSQDCVDKVIIVYRNYEFWLVGVSLTGDNQNPPSIPIGENSFRFKARDVRLGGTSIS